MPNQMPWSRLIAEAVVVVTSILLAFTIDAGWDQHQLLQEEQEMLRGLERELEEGKLVIEASRATTLEAQERLLFFLSATPEDVSRIPSAAAMDEVYLPLIRQWGGGIPRGFLDAATGSGQLATVRNPTLSAALARLGSRHDQVDGIRGLIGDLDIKTAAVLGEVELTYDASGNPDIGAEALRSFREDPRVRGAASAKFMFVRGYLGILKELEDAIDEILVLIRDTVGD